MIDKKYFTEKLLGLRKKTEEALIKTRKSTQPIELDQSTMGRVSRIDAMQQREMYLASERKHEATLLYIDIALRKIGTSDFGFCSHCGEEILLKRLELNPIVSLCMECANNQI